MSVGHKLTRTTSAPPAAAAAPPPPPTSGGRTRTSVDLASTIQVTFSKPIARWGGSVSAIQRGGTVIAVAGQWALDQSKTRLTFTPASQLAAGVEHVVRLYDATDAAGNEIAESRFVTRPIARAGAKAEAQAAEDAMFTTCWANEAKARDPKTDGYLIGRHNWCAIQQVVRGDVEVGGKQVIKDNGLKADATIVGYANGNQTGASETLTLTVTIPDAGTLTAENTLERMGFNLTLTHRPTPGDIPDPGDLVFVQLPTGVITMDGLSPNDARKEITDRLAGPGYRHWYLSWELGETARLYCRYGDAEGDLLHPEPVDVPFTDWTYHLGPLGPYADLVPPTTQKNTRRSSTLKPYA